MKNLYVCWTCSSCSPSNTRLPVKTLRLDIVPPVPELNTPTSRKIVPLMSTGLQFAIWVTCSSVEKSVVSIWFLSVSLPNTF